jgi:hypothetical protein
MKRTTSFGASLSKEGSCVVGAWIGTDIAVPLMWMGDEPGWEEWMGKETGVPLGYGLVEVVGELLLYSPTKMPPS